MRMRKAPVEKPYLRGPVHGPGMGVKTVYSSKAGKTAYFGFERRTVCYEECRCIPVLSPRHSPFFRALSLAAPPTLKLMAGRSTRKARLDDSSSSPEPAPRACRPRPPTHRHSATASERTASRKRPGLISVSAYTSASFPLARHMPSARSQMSRNRAPRPSTRTSMSDSGVASPRA